MANIGKTEPAHDMASVTPSDTVNIEPTRGLFIGGSGNLKVITSAGSTITLTGVVAGSILPVSVKRVFATGTTALNIAALY
jgi:hypothetical protein